MSIPSGGGGGNHGDLYRSSLYYAGEFENGGFTMNETHQIFFIHIRPERFEFTGLPDWKEGYKIATHIWAIF